MYNFFKYAGWRICSRMVRPGENIFRSFTVCVEGNIGSGKTTFLQHFQEFSNTLVLPEPVELWRDVSGTNLLDLFYSDSNRYAYIFQSYVQLTRLQLHTKNTKLPFKVIERSIYSTRCFIKNMRLTEMITDVEKKCLEEWYEWSVSNSQIETDLIVYLRSTPEVVYERMRKRAREEESCVPLEYLKSMHQIYEEWLYDRTSFSVPAPVITIDGDQSIEQMQKEFQRCKKIIYDGQIDD